MELGLDQLGLWPSLDVVVEFKGTNELEHALSIVIRALGALKLSLPYN